MNKLRQTPIFRFARKLKRLIKPPIHRPEVNLNFSLLGSEYGGWPVLAGSLNSESRIYSFGIGHDISFDLEVIALFDCVVEAFDPTPRCMTWLKKQELPDKFRFHPVGLSDQTEVLEFFAPPEDNYVSFTIAKREDSSESVALPVHALDELMSQLGDFTLDYLKMDIEGAEYPVVYDMIKKSILPTQLCIEFHHGKFGFTAGETREAVSALQSVGYRIFYVSTSGREYGFKLNK